MGLVLDSVVLIAAERDARPVSELLATFEQKHGETEIVLSSITVVELEHSLHLANSGQLGPKLDQLCGEFRPSSPASILDGCAVLVAIFSVTGPKEPCAGHAALAGVILKIKRKARVDRWSA